MKNGREKERGENLKFTKAYQILLPFACFFTELTYKLNTVNKTKQWPYKLEPDIIPAYYTLLYYNIL